MKSFVAALPFLLLLPAALPLAGQSTPTAAANAAGSGSRFAVAFAPSSLGLGVQVSARVLESSNVRVGFNDFNFGHTFTNDGLQYTGRLDMRSVQATYDWFFHGSLHLSPGVLAWNNNHATARVYAPPGQQFSLGGTTYTSSSSDPVNGNGYLNLGKTAPMLLVGIGNPVPRGAGHFSMNLDVGAAFENSPNVTLSLTGTACDSTDTFCAPVNSYPGLSANVASEQAKLNKKMHPFRYYPVVALSFSYSFGHAR